MKPSWKNAPEWAEYLVRDIDCVWWWYENMPSNTHGYWGSRTGQRQRETTTIWEPLLFCKQDDKSCAK